MKNPRFAAILPFCKRTTIVESSVFARVISHWKVRLKHHLSAHFTSSEKVLLLFIIVMAGVMTLVVPPFQKPDEPTHFLKAVSIAQGNLICSKTEDSVFANTIPSYLHRFPEQLLAEHIASGKQVVFPRSIFFSILNEKNTDHTLINSPSSCSLPSLPYIHLGVVLWLPVHLHASPILIFYLGRVANLVIAGAMCYWAVLLTPKKLRKVPLTILAFPLSLQQLTSFSKDAVFLAAGLVVIALLLHFLIQKTKITAFHLVAFFSSLLLVIMSRPQYAPLSLLVFLIPRSKTRDLPIKIRQLAMLFIITLVVLVGIGLSLEVFSAKSSSLGTVAPNQYVIPELQLQYLSNPVWRFGTVMYATLEQNWLQYFREMVGVLGWLEYAVPWYVYILYGGLIAYVGVMANDHWPSLKLWQMIILVSAVLGSAAAVMLAMYIYATPVGNKVIVALQGRYFTLLVPLVFWLISAAWNQARNTVIFFIGILVLISVTGSIMSRYYFDLTHYEQVQASLHGNEVITRLTEAQTYQLALQPNRKIAGFRLSILPNAPHPLTTPYELHVFDDACRLLLRHKVLAAPTLQSGGEIDVTFNPLATKQATGVCVKLAPYGVKVDTNEALQLRGTQVDQMITPGIVPLYLY